MSTWQESLSDARTRLDKAAEQLAAGNWQLAIFELGCASARIFQVVEELPDSLKRQRGE